MNKEYDYKEILAGEAFDPKIISADAPFTQTNLYGNWQKSLNRKVRRFVVKKGDNIIAYFQMIRYPLLMGKSYFYIPYGPVTKDFSENFFRSLKEEINKIAKEEKTVFTRLDFSPFVSNEILSKYFIKAPLYTYHSAYFQPRREWFLGLQKSEEEILMGMHEKTRYSVRLSERKGIKAEIITKDFDKYFEIFYELMLGTAKRNGFSLHAKKYYENVFQELSVGDNNYLCMAKYGEKILAIDLVVVSGKVANYVFGGSSDEERNRMPTYLSHWEAIRYAKKLGCDYYNFGAVSSEEDSYKGWDGLTVFKKKFGGQEMVHSDFFDVVSNPFWYRIYNLRKLIKKFI